MKKNLIDEIKSISITARVAFGLICLEKCIKNEKLFLNNTFLWLLNEMWSYTNTSDAASWQEEMDEACPEVIFDERAVYEEFEKITPQMGYELRSLYDEIPAYITRIVDEVILIGTSNLYAGTGEYAKNSHFHTMNVIQIMEDKNIPLPSIEIFREYSFKEKGGWGRGFDKEEIVSKLK
ncbi:hypothetical protein R9C00_06425 [Flammeovirgaceae bacterium SG7u.111]|nr:hypothetical protein [Flammeovirgaceae bacterium SG7u.132]WPO37077.1 hypothetical protein R9C00_06425 [Flammeovirgaceae bacterium SG7u.111]